MEGKKLRKKLDKIPDVDKNGDPIYKITDMKDKSGKNKTAKKDNR